MTALNFQPFEEPDDAWAELTINGLKTDGD